MARREHGTGTIKEKNGSIWIAFRPAPGAKQIWEKVGRVDEGVTEADAKALLEQRRVEARRGLVTNTRLTLEEASAAWMEERSFAKLAPKTRESEKTALDCHLLPAFGLDYLDSITPDLIRRYISKKLRFPPGHPEAAPVRGKVAEARTAPLGTSAVNQQVQALSKVFEWAIENGKAVSNPCRRVKKPELRQEPKEVEVFEIEEVKALLAAAGSEEDRAIFLLMAGCGLRIGEVFGLEIRDFSPADRVLHVRRSIQRDWGATRLGKAPKTRSGDRYLVVEAPIAEAISRQIQRLRDELRTDSGLLFPNQVGRVRSAENFRSRNWKEALKSARLPLNRTPHALRHTFASELIQAGRSDTDISSKMGHKNAQITRTIYGKSFARTRATEAGVVDLYLRKGDDRFGLEDA